MKTLSVMLLVLFWVASCGCSASETSEKGVEESVQVPPIDMAEHGNIATATFAMG
ncbi:MAG: hypothetical protein ACLFN0_08995 [Thermovirgaceae bacterium]